MPQETPKSKQTYEYGVKTWYCPNEPTVDICFVHGLTGHRDKTWTGAGAQKPWPLHLLAEKFPQARLLTFGYDADIVRVGVAAQDTIKSLADNLLYSLRDDRDEAGAAHRPLVFIVHSLGGIVCKKAVARSQHSADETLARIATLLIGIVFMGTPHDGSSLADLAGRLVSSLGWFKSTNKALLKVLERDNQVAADIDSEFWEACNVIAATSTEIRIFCFFEARPPRAIKKRVVPENSAVYKHKPSQKIDANHHNMVKFLSADDPGFKSFCGVLRNFLSSTRATLLLSSEWGPSPGEIPPPASRGPPQSPPQNPPPLHHGSSSGSDSQNNASASSAPSGQQNDNLPSHHCYLVPFYKNRNFVGREDVLQKLRVLLFEDAHPIVAMYGLGGVGKTQVANALVHWVKEHTDHSIYWVPALSRSGFEAAYAAIAEKLGIQHTDKLDIKILVRNYLSSDAAGPWFLVLDNADDPELICGRDVSDSLVQYLPQSDHGRILVTTRTKTVARAVAQKVMSLETFDLSQARQLATALLENSTLLGDDVSLADALFRELECLPLALTQAMAYMDQANVSAEEYVRLLRGTEKDKIDLLGNEFSDSTRYRESRHAVTATWLVSFDHLQKTHPDSVALLEFLSQIQPKAIPISMLPRPESGSNAALLNAVSALCAYGFVSKREDMLDMHSLVHMATRSWVENGSLATVRAEALRHTASFLRDQPHRGATRTPYFPHVLFLIHDANSANNVGANTSDWVALCRWVEFGLHLDDRGEDALQYAEFCMRWADASLEKDDPSLFDVYISLALALLEQHRDSEAIALLNSDAVSIFLDRPVQDAEEYLRMQTNVAMVYYKAGKYQEVIELLEKAVGIQKEMFAVTDLGSAQLLQYLALAYSNVGRHSEALQILNDIYFMARTLAEDDNMRLSLEQSLATVQEAAGQTQEAVRLLEHIIPIRKKSGVESDSSLIMSQRTLGRMYMKHGQAAQAVRLLKHVVHVQKETLAETSAARLASEKDLAQAYFINDQTQDAVDLFKHVVRVQKETLAETSMSRLNSESDLARAYRKNGQTQDAVDLFEHVVRVREEIPVEASTPLLGVKIELAQAYHENGQTKDAVDLLKHVARVQKESLAETSVARFDLESDLAEAYLQIGQTQDAIDLLEHVWSIWRLTDDDPKKTRIQRLLRQARWEAHWEDPAFFCGDGRSDRWSWSDDEP